MFVTLIFIFYLLLVLVVVKVFCDWKSILFQIDFKSNVLFTYILQYFYLQKFKNFEHMNYFLIMCKILDSSVSITNNYLHYYIFWKSMPQNLQLYSSDKNAPWMCDCNIYSLCKLTFIVIVTLTKTIWVYYITESKQYILQLL